MATLDLDRMRPLSNAAALNPNADVQQTITREEDLAARYIELDEGPLFISIPVDAAGEPVRDGAGLRDGVRTELEWADSEDEFGDYRLPVFRAVG